MSIWRKFPDQQPEVGRYLCRLQHRNAKSKKFDRISIRTFRESGRWYREEGIEEHAFRVIGYVPMSEVEAALS